MRLLGDGLTIGGLSGFDNPLDRGDYPKKDYSEGKVSKRISYRKIWLDRYAEDGYGSYSLEILSNGKCFLEGRELKQENDVKTVREIFDNLKIS